MAAPESKRTCVHCAGYELWFGTCTKPESPRFASEAEGIGECKPCKYFELEESFKNDQPGS